MKKITAVLLATLLLFGILVCGVSAEGFEFKELERRIDGNNLILTWNYGEVPAASVVEVEDVLIGSVSCGVSESVNGVLTVDISDLSAGVYPSITYEYMLDEQPKTATVTKSLVIPGTVQVSLSMSFDNDGFVTVKATDASGNPVAGYKLLLSIGDMAEVPETTGKDGTFTSRMMAEYDEGATCRGETTDAGNGVIYAEAAEVTLTRVRPTTTAVTTTTTATADATTTIGNGDETTTTVADADTTKPSSSTKNKTTTSGVSSSTHATIRGAGTTSKQDDKIAVNVSLDTNILELFGLEQADFDNNARLLLSENDYSALVGRSSHLLMLNVLTAQAVPTDAQVQEAVAGVSKYSGYAEADRQALTFDLSFLILNKSTGEEIPVSALPLNSTYLVQLPVPESMKDCAAFAVTVSNGDSLVEPIPVEVKNGCFQLQINSLEPYTLIGFGTGGRGSANSNSILLIVLMIVGILLLVGAAVLLYVFVL
ncbi:MAG: hypothetical protein IKA63_03325, partial [Clostridia bacterium]|nr:hypothetical protein [Clostridia bacterium]